MSIRLSVLFLQPKNLEKHNNLLKKFREKKKSHGEFNRDGLSIKRV